MRYFFVFCLWAAATLLLKGQSGEYSEQGDFVANLNHAFEHLNLSEANTGYLLDRSFQLIDVGIFDGVSNTPENDANADVFGSVYATLMGAAFDPVIPLTGSDDYMAAAANTNSGSEVIPISFFAWKYNRFDPDAVNHNLISIQNGQFFDVPGRPQSPYLEKTTFVASLMGSTTKKNTLRFSFPTNLEYTNLGVTFQSFTVDIGNGVQTALPGEELSVQFPNSGDYDVLITATMSNATVFHGHSIITVTSNSGNRFSTTPVNFAIPATNEHSGMILNVFYNTHGCDDPPVCDDPMIPCRLIRPLIIIDGFDEGNDRTYTDVLNRIAVEPFLNDTKTLEDFIEEGGYDLIFLDYNEGGDDIARNGLGVEDAIKQINAWKNANGSFEQNIIVGASMGGLTGKYALMKMEEENYDYQTSKFFNLDGPMYGANLPLGLQYMLHHVTNIQVPWWLQGVLHATKLKDLMPGFAGVEALLNSQALKQQIIYKVQENNPNDFTDDAHTDFMNIFHQLGRTGDGKIYDCEYIVLCDGAINGIGQQHADGVTVTPGAQIFAIHANGIQNLGAFDHVSGFWGTVIGLTSRLLLGTGGRVDLEAWTVPDHPASPKKVYAGSIAIDALGLTIVNTTAIVKVLGTRPLDTAPGGTADFGALTKLIEENPGLADIITIFTPVLCFVPTVSSLDIYPPSDILNADYSNVPGISGSGITPTDRYVGSTDDDNHLEDYPFGQFNNHHAGIHDNIARYLISEIMGTEAINAPDLLTLDNRTYNFGDSQLTYSDSGNSPGDFVFTHTGNSIRHDLTVEGSGKIWVNRKGIIAFTDDANNPENATTSAFHVYLSGGGCSASSTSTVTVKDGGEISIGEWDTPIANMGFLHVTKNSRLDIKRSGTVLVNDNAALYVEGDGITTVDGGLLHVNWPNGRIIVHGGGILHIKGSSILRVSNGAKMIVEAGGKLILDEGAETQLWGDPAAEDGESTIQIKSGGELVINGDIRYSGNGFFQFDKGNILTLNTPVFKLTGSGKEVRFMRFNTLAGITVGNGHTFQFSDGQIENAAIGAENGGRIVFSNLHCTDGSTALYAINPGLVSINNVQFTGFDPALEFENVEPNKLVLVSNSIIEGHGSIGVSALSCHHLQFSNVSIFGNGQANAGTGIQLYDVEHVSLNNCHIVDENVGILVSDARTLVMSGGEIGNCLNGISDETAWLSAAPSNVLMFEGATIRDCEVGIHLTGNISRGSVLMDCARLIDNNIGIQGQDITLMVDAEENRHCSSDPLAPNTFTLGNGDAAYFAICYVLKPIASVNAKGNYWFPHNPGNSGPIFGTWWLGKSPLSSGPPCSTPLALISDNAIADQPQGCPVAPIDLCNPHAATPPSAKCEIHLENDLFEVHESFHKGIESIKTQSFDTGDELLTPVSDLHNDPNTVSLGATCKDFINMAFAIIENGEGNAMQNNLEVRSAPKTIDLNAGIAVIPNPASEMVEISMPKIEAEISIFDNLGRLKFTGIAKESLLIPVKDWGNGVYWVRVRMQEDVLPGTAKLIIQH